MVLQYVKYVWHIGLSVCIFLEEETKNLRRIKNGAKVRILFALSNSCGDFLLIGSSYSEGRISLTISCMEVFPL